MLQKTAKTQTQFHQEVKCHTKRSFHPTNQAKCRACYVLSTYWLFSASLRRKIAKAKTFWTKVATDATSKRHNMAKDFKVKVVTSCLHSKPKEMFQKHHISSQSPRNCMLTETFPFKRFVLHQNYFQTSPNLFFLPVPCALEALTVINLLVEIVHSHA